jgi:hypothetical protein
MHPCVVEFFQPEGEMDSPDDPAHRELFVVHLPERWKDNLMN